MASPRCQDGQGRICRRQGMFEDWDGGFEQNATLSEYFMPEFVKMNE